MTTKDDSIAEIQVSDFNTSTEIEDTDSIRCRSLPEVPMTSEDGDTCDANEMK